MARTRWIGVLAAAILMGAACTASPALPSPPTPAIAPGQAPPAVSQPPTPAATASPGRVARQVYTAFRYDPEVRSAEDLPVLLALHGLEVNP